MSAVTVIGATCPLGSALVPAIARSGSDVYATYRDVSRVPSEWLTSTNIRPVGLDLSGSEPVPGLDADTLVWLAHLDAGRSNPDETKTNLQALERILSQARNSNISRIVFVSSGGSVYGNAVKLPIHETHIRQPLSSYGIAKAEMEDRLLAFGRRASCKIAILRPGNIYGFERKGRQTKGVLGAFLNSLHDGTSFTRIHGGKAVRDMIHVDDVCRAVELALASEKDELIWNVGTGVGTEIRKTLEIVLEVTGAKMPDLIEIKNFETDVLENVLSVERILDESGWSAAIDVRSGVEDTIGRWLDGASRSAMIPAK